MKSGAYFSSIFIIWIIGILVSFYMLYPAINTSIKTTQHLQTNGQFTVKETSGTAVDLVDYTPLGIFEKLGL